MRVVTAGKWKTHMKKESNLARHSPTATTIFPFQKNQNFAYLFYFEANPRTDQLHMKCLRANNPKLLIRTVWNLCTRSQVIVLFLPAAHKITHTDIHFACEGAKIRRLGIRNNVTRDTAPKYKGFLPFCWLDISFWLDSWHTMNYKV